MDISVIVPLYNEAESLPELTAWIERVMEENKFSYEIWFQTLHLITQLRNTYNCYRNRCNHSTQYIDGNNSI